MKKAMKLVWMVLFALPFLTLTACGDDDELVDDNTGATVELKDYSDLIGKKYTEVLDKMGQNFDKDETNQYQIVYYNIDTNVSELDVAFTFYEPEDAPTLYEKAVFVNVEVNGFSNSYLLNRLQKLYGEGTAHEEDGEIWYTYEKDGKYVLYEYDAYSQEGEISYFDKKEYDKVFDTKADAKSLKAVRNNLRAK